jgi:hypothetical protein
VIVLRLIEVSHSGVNIVESIVVVEEYGLVNKIFFVTLDNASSNTSAMNTLTPIFASYLVPDPDPDHDPFDPQTHNVVLAISLVKL